MAQENETFTLADLYLAYRKAKAEAFHENTQFHAIAFTQYEVRLHRKLLRLHRLLNSPQSTWVKASFVGGYLYGPKGMGEFPNGGSAGPQLTAIDPNEEWRKRFENAGRARAQADFRLVIVPTVDFQIVAALWILKVGELLDAQLDDDHSYGNRIRRIYGPTGDAPAYARRAMNRDCLGLFPPYFSAYRKWRENGLHAMRTSLESGKRIVAVTMDLRRFYHNVSPRFLTRPDFFAALGVTLPEEVRRFNADFVDALDAWYRETPDFKDREAGALPVGLSASKVMSNVLLREFDVAVSQRLSPIYYGRYVDDIFLVLPHPREGFPGNDVLRWIARKLSPMLNHVEDDSSEGTSLRLNFPYAADADLVFAGTKQKVFDLSNEYGLDLVEHISEQIRIQSSEHRMLPELPKDDVEMAARGLLATPNAALEVDALRKADVVSIRRLGLSLLLRDVEAYARDLRPTSWKPQREQFYRLVRRYLLTPRGLFDYFGYIHRVFALMIASSDFSEASRFLQKVKAVSDTLRETTTCGAAERLQFGRCLGFYAAAFVQAALQASTVDRFTQWQKLSSLLRQIQIVGQYSPIALAPGALRNLSRRILLSDWGRRPYKEFWLFSQKHDAESPAVPVDNAIRRLIRLGQIRRFRTVAELRRPYWPALAFPTRPLRVDEIGLIAPRVFEDSSLFRHSIMALRGARVASRQPIGFVPATGRDAEHDLVHFVVPDDPRGQPRIALTSVQTSDLQWKRAVTRRPDLSLKRYRTLRSLVNRVLRDRPRTRYIAFPECSLPLQWALPMATKLAQNRISLLAGIEYRYDRRRGRLRNDCLVSLTTKWPGYPTNVVRLQPKLVPAHHERLEIRKLSAHPLYEPAGPAAMLPIYQHGDFFFGVLLCSDLTNIENRTYFQGAVDALWVLEWNRDLATFEFLVESTSHDLHAFVVQVNNRQYGDSRIRAPYRDANKRDLVRVKGGIGDYYVLAKIEHLALREFQHGRGKLHVEKFKPLPIGFRMSVRRRASVR